MATELKYLEDSELYELTGTIVRIENQDFSSDTVVVLDETIFYPQGGGQPTDKGSMTGTNGRMNVQKVHFADGDVFHTGTMIEGDFGEGDTLNLSVDSDLRKLHARLHTGGHLVMTAVDRLLHLPAVKGYHFPNGPYVEFIGSIPFEGREGTLQQIQGVLDSLVEEDSEVTARFESIENLRSQGVYIPAEIPSDKPTRVVVTSGYQSPCGGTHVRTLGQLKGLTARGIKSKSGNVRVSYTFAD